MAGFDWLAEVRRLGGLEFTPQTAEAWLELARTLKKRSASAEHARRIIDRFLEPGAPQKCPSPGDMAVVASQVPADPKLDRPELADPCNACSPFGGNWREGTRGGVERCSCPRGQKLRLLDEVRRVPEVERRHSSGIAAVADFARRAAGDIE